MGVAGVYLDTLSFLAPGVSGRGLPPTREGRNQLSGGSLGADRGQKAGGGINGESGKYVFCESINDDGVFDKERHFSSVSTSCSLLYK